MKTKKLIMGLSLLSFVILSGCCRAFFKNEVCLEYIAQPDIVLPSNLIHDMVNTYRNNQRTQINAAMHMNDAGSVLFSLETLKKFIHEIEHTTVQTDNKISSEDLGVRIYYAAYPLPDGTSRYGEALAGINLNPSSPTYYGNHHTVVMVPTIKRDTLHIDYNPLDLDTYETSLREIPGERYGPGSNNLALALTVNVQPGRGTNFVHNQNSNFSRGGWRSNTRMIHLNATNSILNTVSQNHGNLIPPRSTGTQEEGFGQ